MHVKIRFQADICDWRKLPLHIIQPSFTDHEKIKKQINYKTSKDILRKHTLYVLGNNIISISTNWHLQAIYDTLQHLSKCDYMIDIIFIVAWRIYVKGLTMNLSILKFIINLHHGMHNTFLSWLPIIYDSNLKPHSCIHFNLQRSIMCNTLKFTSMEHQPKYKYHIRFFLFDKNAILCYSF